MLKPVPAINLKYKKYIDQYCAFVLSRSKKYKDENDLAEWPAMLNASIPKSRPISFKTELSFTNSGFEYCIRLYNGTIVKNTGYWAKYVGRHNEDGCAIYAFFYASADLVALNTEFFKMSLGESKIQPMLNVGEYGSHPVDRLTIALFSQNNVNLYRIGRFSDTEWKYFGDCDEIPEVTPNLEAVALVSARQVLGDFFKHRFSSDVIESNRADPEFVAFLRK